MSRRCQNWQLDEHLAVEPKAARPENRAAFSYVLAIARSLAIELHEHLSARLQIAQNRRVRLPQQVQKALDVPPKGRVRRQLLEHPHEDGPQRRQYQERQQDEKSVEKQGRDVD